MNIVRSLRLPGFYRSVEPSPLPAAIVHQPRVFTDSFQERLAALNVVDRELRKMGLPVVWTRLAGPKPQAHFKRDPAVSIADLLDQMGPRSFRHDNGCTVVSAEFKGVIVSWVEPS